MTADHLSLLPGGDFDQLFCPRGGGFTNFFNRKCQIPKPGPPPPTLLRLYIDRCIILARSDIYFRSVVETFLFWSSRTGLAGDVTRLNNTFLTARRKQKNKQNHILSNIAKLILVMFYRILTYPLFRLNLKLRDNSQIRTTLHV